VATPALPRYGYDGDRCRGADDRERRKGRQPAAPPAPPRRLRAPRAQIIRKLGEIDGIVLKRRAH
jgi:hypothetical protein